MFCPYVFTGPCACWMSHTLMVYLIHVWENSVSHISVGVPYEYTCTSVDVAMLNQVKCCTDYYNSIRIALLTLNFIISL